MKIPFVDLKLQYRNIKSEIDEAIEHVIEDAAFIRGKYVAEFEKNYAEKYGVKHCISVANGTDAIYIALKMLGIGRGDEVITVANSWISTSETITLTGAKPVFVDIDDYYTIDISKIKEKISPRTKALVPVHLFGQPSELGPIKDLCAENKLFLIEDCAQAHFAKYKKANVGTFGIAATFSFYPGKNLGAYGDAGAIITDNDELASKLRMYANHGAKQKHHHEIEGINSRMDGIQAAILNAKLKYIEDWNRSRFENAMLYNELLSGIDEIIVPKIRPNVSHIFHLYVIRTKYRDGLKKFLQEHNIDTAIHYPTALPFLSAYKYLNHTPDQFPVAYEYQKEILSLPMFPELTQNQIEYVVSNIKKFLKTK